MTFAEQLAKTMADDLCQFSDLYKARVVGKSLEFDDSVKNMTFVLSEKACESLVTGQPIHASSMPHIEIYDSSGVFIQNTAEFFLSVGDDGANHQADFRFKIGDVVARSSTVSPSLYFFARNTDYHPFAYDHEQDEVTYSTIILEGVTKENAVSSLDKALFVLGSSSDWEYTQWPTAGLPNGEEFFKIDDGKILPDFSNGDDLIHEVPLNSFNAAMRAKANAERLILLYRTLEFYTTIAMEEAIIEEIRAKPKDPSTASRILSMISQDIKKDQNSFIRVVSLIPAVKEIIEEYALHLGNGVSTPNDLGLRIYSLRCRLVHGKENSSYSCEIFPRHSKEGVEDYWVLMMTELCASAIRKWSMKKKKRKRK